MALFVRCSNCRAQLQAPQGATTIRCSYCHVVTRTVVTNHRPLPPPSRTLGQPMVGRKKAVICGINYKGSEAPLEGCINDAKSMKRLLINKFKFPESGIIVLTEEEKNPNNIPTKRNIMKAMSWLVAGVRAGDSLVFYFSGHGSQEKEEDDDDDDGDEEDGFNESLCPLDNETNGNIIDDEINDTIVKPIPRGAKLTALIDACHSGTMLDLPFLCRINRRGKFGWEEHSPRPGIWEGTSGGEAISISGCDDHQESDETPHAKTTGAMTYSFIQAIEKGHATTYGSLLNAMREVIRDVARKKLEHDDGPTSPIQVPLLCANEPFDAYTKPFTL